MSSNNNENAASAAQPSSPGVRLLRVYIGVVVFVGLFFAFEDDRPPAGRVAIAFGMLTAF